MIGTAWRGTRFGFRRWWRATGRLVKPFALEIASPFSFWLVCRKNRLGEATIIAFRYWILEQASVQGAA